MKSLVSAEAVQVKGPKRRVGVGVGCGCGESGETGEKEEEMYSRSLYCMVNLILS